ncbi:MAG: YbaK/EbsC family protein [Streptosporangiaceae bacterium]
MKDALAIHRLLLERETQHEIVRLPSQISSAVELPSVLGLPPSRCMVTRIYACDLWQLVAVIVQAGTEPNLSAVREAVGALVIEPADVDTVNRETDYSAELVAPLLLPDSMTVLVDQRFVDRLDVDDVVYTATGEGSTALGIRSFDLWALSGAKPVNLARPLRSGT